MCEITKMYTEKEVEFNSDSCVDLTGGRASSSSGSGVIGLEVRF